MLHSSLCVSNLLFSSSASLTSLPVSSSCFLHAVLEPAEDLSGDGKVKPFIRLSTVSVSVLSHKQHQDWACSSVFGSMPTVLWMWETLWVLDLRQVLVSMKGLSTEGGCLDMHTGTVICWRYHRLSLQQGNSWTPAFLPVIHQQDLTDADSQDL